LLKYKDIKEDNGFNITEGYFEALKKKKEEDERNELNPDSNKLNNIPRKAFSALKGKLILSAKSRVLSADPMQYVLNLAETSYLAQNIQMLDMKQQDYRKYHNCNIVTNAYPQVLEKPTIVTRFEDYFETPDELALKYLTKKEIEFMMLDKKAFKEINDHFKQMSLLKHKKLQDKIIGEDIRKEEKKIKNKTKARNEYNEYKNRNLQKLNFYNNPNSHLISKVEFQKKIVCYYTYFKIIYYNTIGSRPNKKRCHSIRC